MTAEQVREIVKCANGVEGCIYFLNTYAFIENPQQQKWERFLLWPEQEDVVRQFFDNDKLVVLKARQLGLSWLILWIQLWYMLFRPGSAVTMFSVGEREAIYLLRDRMKPAYRRLPVWMRSPVEKPDREREWRLRNGSVARSFPSTAGDSYTTTVALVDEADLMKDLEGLLLAVEPTVSAGGKLVLISKADKKKPNSLFKRTYRAAKEGKNDWCNIFLPWHIRPERTKEWYEKKKASALETDGTLDNIYENYPATDEEALSARTLDKRIPEGWLGNVRAVQAPLPLETLPDAPAIPGLRIFVPPVKGRSYVIGADPAEGNPNSDDSALCVLDAETYEQVATLAGKYEPSTFAGYIKDVAEYYNKAIVLVERNNHGHAVLLWLRDHGPVKRMKGEDKKSGWLSSTKGKTIMYNMAAEVCKNSETIIHDFETCIQLGNIEGTSLRAPDGDRDDCADAFALAVVAAHKRPSFEVRTLN